MKPVSVSQYLVMLSKLIYLLMQKTRAKFVMSSTHAFEMRLAKNEFLQQKQVEFLKVLHDYAPTTLPFFYKV